MSEFIQTIIILAIIAVMGFFLYLYYKKTHPGEIIKKVIKKKSKDKEPVNGNRDETPEESSGGETRVWSDINVSELDKHGKVIKKTGVMVHPRGFTIGTGEKADFRVSADEYVSRIHIRVGKDDNGYFVKDTSLNGTECKGKMYHNQSFDLPFDEVIYIGNTPIVFTERKKERLQKDATYTVNEGTGTRLFSVAKDEPDHDDNVLRR